MSGWIFNFQLHVTWPVSWQYTRPMFEYGRLGLSACHPFPESYKKISISNLAHVWFLPSMDSGKRQYQYPTLLSKLIWHGLSRLYGIVLKLKPTYISAQWKWSCGFSIWSRHSVKHFVSRLLCWDGWVTLPAHGNHRWLGIHRYWNLSTHDIWLPCTIWHHIIADGSKSHAWTLNVRESSWNLAYNLVAKTSGGWGEVGGEGGWRGHQFQWNAIKIVLG